MQLQPAGDKSWQHGWEVLALSIERRAGLRAGLPFDSYSSDAD